MYHDMTRGNIARSLLLFSLPMMVGNLLQQFYNIADTLIVGRVLGGNALAAVGSAYTLMTFLTSIFLGLSLGSGALFSIYRGQGDAEKLKSSIVHAFFLILGAAAVLNLAAYICIDPILRFLRVPDSVWAGMYEYLMIIFAGIIATALYNFFHACCVRWAILRYLWSFWRPRRCSISDWISCLLPDFPGVSVARHGPRLLLSGYPALAYRST